eukprot:8902955-Pyramimonas_sp.AAC.1
MLPGALSYVTREMSSTRFPAVSRLTIHRRRQFNNSFQRAGAFACSTQRELSLLAELEPQTYSYYSSYLDRRSRFSQDNSSFSAAQLIDPE